MISVFFLFVLFDLFTYQGSLCLVLVCILNFKALLLLYVCHLGAQLVFILFRAAVVRGKPNAHANAELMTSSWGQLKKKKTILMYSCGA